MLRYKVTIKNDSVTMGEKLKILSLLNYSVKLFEICSTDNSRL